MTRILPLALGLALCACSTVGTVRLNADKAFLTADIALKSAQQTVLAGCSLPTAKGTAPCNTAIDLLHTGAQYEAAGFAAQQAGSSADVATATTNLTNLISQLATLGVLKAN